MTQTQKHIASVTRSAHSNLPRKPGWYNGKKLLQWACHRSHCNTLSRVGIKRSKQNDALQTRSGRIVSLQRNLIFEILVNIWFMVHLVHDTVWLLQQYLNGLTFRHGKEKGCRMNSLHVDQQPLFHWNTRTQEGSLICFQSKTASERKSTNTINEFKIQFS